MSNIGGSIGTTFKVVRSDGQIEEFEIVSEEAVLRVLRNSCVRKLRTHEPFFVLRGQDSSAPDYVMTWAQENQTTLAHDKFVSAQETAVAMENWPQRRSPD